MDAAKLFNGILADHAAAQAAVAPRGLYLDLLPPRTPSTEDLADAALLALSKLRDRLVVENANLPACRVDEAMEITLAAVRGEFVGEAR